MNTIVRIRSLYEEHPEAGRLFESEPRRAAPTLNALLSGLEASPPPDFSMTSLDTYSGSSNSSLDLAIALVCLPGRAVYDRLGHDALFWAWTEYPTDRLRDSLTEITGRDPRMLENARSSASWLPSGAYNGATVLSIFRLIEHVNNGFTRSCSLAANLTACVRENVNLHEIANNYTLEPLIAEEQQFGHIYVNRRFGLVLDTPVGIGLMYRGEPNAIVAVTAARPKTLMIHQLQGVRPPEVSDVGDVVGKASTYDLPFDWKRLMVDGCSEPLARELGFPLMGIRSGHNNPWTRVRYPDGRVHLPLDRALKIYDGTAERLDGFEKGCDRNWYRRLV